MRHALLIAVIFASLFVSASTLTRGHEWGDDFASYIMQAESIWNGTTRQFIQHNSSTIFESSNQIGPIAYPWGYPLILMPVYALKGIHPLALKLPGLFFYAGFLACLYLLMKTRLGQTESLLIVCLFAFDPLLVRFLDQILSDIPFLFFSTLTLFFMQSRRPLTNRLLVLIGILISLAYFIRTTGVLLLASFIAVKILEAFNERTTVSRNIKEVLVVCVIFGLLFLLSLLLFPQGETSHLLRFQEFNIARALRFTGSYFAVFGSFFGEGVVWQIIYYVLLVCFLIGAWAYRKQDLLFIVFFALWMILLIVWPAWQGPRLIFPLLPIFIYFAFQGINVLLGRLSDPFTATGRWLFYGFWSLMILIFLFTSSRNAYINLKNDRLINGPFDPYSQEVYRYIKERTPADSMIIFFKPRVMRMMTDHDSIMSTECDRILKGDYLVLSKKVGENQQIPPEEIGACGLPLEQVFSNNRFVIYQIQSST
jgi:4-amino-4-deoxy-L-arabinose transferase-like glycosyltransferase